ncbi:MAG: sigma 54-interacting transcriptional regulator [Gemmatimonadota bacterium]|nr:sigma 54-interacting transcriptional regulator [Gemmatimonadota bacterium]
MITPLDRNGTWRTYAVADGLPSVRIEHIAEDNLGHIWFATSDNGAARYDGDEFVTFTTRDGLCSNWLCSMHRDRNERLWFATMNGVCWYDGTSIHVFEDDGISGRPVQCLFEDDRGRIWCAGIGTLGYYDGSRFHDLVPLYQQRYGQPPAHRWHNECRGIAQDREGHLWFGFDYPVRFDGETFSRYEEEEGFTQAEIGYAVGRSPAGKVWIGLPRSLESVYCYDDAAFQSVEVDRGGGLMKVQSDRDGRVWFCTKRGALYKDGDTFRRLTSADGLPHSAVRAMFHDSEHRFWFATRGGVGLYDAHNISVFDPGVNPPIDPNEISQLVQDQRGDVWVAYASPVLYRAAGKSIARFDGEQFVFLDTTDGHDVNNCLAMCEDLDGNLWFGGANGLFHYDGRELKAMRPIADLEEKSISAIAQDREGRFLFGYRDHGPIDEREDSKVCHLTVACERDGQLQTISVEAEKDPFSRIGTVISGLEGEVYFHTTNGNSIGSGFVRWHPEDGVRFFGLEDGLMDQRVNDLLIDRHGILWIATNGGLARFEGNTIRTLTADDGLVDTCIHCVLEDQQGHIWMGTDVGVVRYDGRLCQTLRSSHIGPVSRILECDDGTFWFGTATGSVIRYRLRQKPPQIRVLRAIADRSYDDQGEAVHATTGHQVVFEYKGTSFSTPSVDMLYIFRLEGYDPDWRPATRNRRAVFRDLPPGDYTFQVRAIDRDLNYSSIAQTRLSVQPDTRISARTIALNRQDDRKFIGQSAALRRFQVNLRKVAATDITVLIMGETGVGKGLAARELHALSPHCDGPYIEVSCGALPVALIDSELFGHVKGAFTSAVSHRLGRVELAAGGTLFLDEIAEMSMETQFKLLRLLEEGTFEQVGSSEPLTARTRIVAASNRNLEEMVRKGAFREDLYYRLNAFPLYLPSLRERKEDIPALAGFFTDRMAAHVGKKIDPLSPEVLRSLQNREWPGNVRELEHAVHRAVVLCAGSRISVEDLIVHRHMIRSPAPDAGGRALTASHRGDILPLEESERRYIISVLEATNWRIKGPRGAAKLLRLHPSTLYSKMRKHGISDQIR